VTGELAIAGAMVISAAIVSLAARRIASPWMKWARLRTQPMVPVRARVKLYDQGELEQPKKGKRKRRRRAKAAEENPSPVPDREPDEGPPRRVEKHAVPVGEPAPPEPDGEVHWGSVEAIGDVVRQPTRLRG
jgi:hypothetical protein